MRPYSYQSDCLSALATARSDGRKKDLVVMATGLGKTAVSAFDLKRLLKEAPGRVLYLCHQKYILAQARKTLESVLGEGYTYGNFNGAEKHLRHVDVLFATFQTMANAREYFGRGEFRYVVVDEVHHAQAATFRPTIEYFLADYLLGLTATLKRADGLDVAELFDGKPSFELDLYEALARKYLCNVDYCVMTDEIQAAGVLDTPVGKLSIAELNRTIFIPKRDKEIAKKITEKTAHIKNPRIMVFCSSIQHAQNMAALLPGAEAIHSELKNRQKDDRQDAFRSGALTTVTTIDMFNEGIDVPEANVIVFLRSTASETIFLQQLGRGLRKADGKTEVLVLDFVANCERIEMVRELERQVRRHRKKSTEVAQRPGINTTGAVDREPLMLTLDGVEFEERAWKLAEVIEGVRAATRLKGISEESLIVGLAEYMQALGRVPKKPDMRVGRPVNVGTYETYRKRFGWYAATARAIEYLRAQGVEIPTEQVRRRNVDDAEMIANLARYIRRLGGMPTPEDMKRGVRPDWLMNTRAYHERFGSWSEGKRLALRQLVAEGWRSSAPRQAAGVTLAAQPASSLAPADLLTQVLAKSKILGRPLRVSEVDDDPEIAASAKQIKTALRASTWAEVIGHIKPYL